MIQNLSQLKTAMKSCPRFEIVAHCRPELAGRIRRVTLANTQGFYSVMDGQPEHKLSRANGGKGAFLYWSKAPAWDFHGGVCALYGEGQEHVDRNLILSFRILREEAA